MIRYVTVQWSMCITCIGNRDFKVTAALNTLISEPYKETEKAELNSLEQH